MAATSGPSEIGWLPTLTVLAALSAVWSAFQWNELLTLRSGGEIFCAVGSSASCAALADSAFALAVQRITGLPIAGFGLVWSGAALALPLGAQLRRQTEGSEEPFWTASVLTAVAGLAGVLLLVAVSLNQGGLCSNCVITYLLIAGYAGVCGLRWQRLRGRVPLQPATGAGVAALATSLGFVALLYPGLQTPLPQSEQLQAAMSKALGSEDHSSHDHSAHGQAAAIPGVVLPSAGGLRALEELVIAMNPQARQVLSDSIALYASSIVSNDRTPRALHGSAEAPVWVTDFTDPLCSHCASLHSVLAGMYERLPPGSFAIDSRHYPLDGNCNPSIPNRQENPVRCVAARAQICMENEPNAFEFAGSLYANQLELDVEMVYQLAAAHMPRRELEACIRAPETDAKLQADIAWAVELGIRGTPLVLLNGKRATSFPPFLFAMVATRGETHHTAFDLLPPPRPFDH